MDQYSIDNLKSRLFTKSNMTSIIENNLENDQEIQFDQNENTIEDLIINRSVNDFNKIVNNFLNSNEKLSVKYSKVKIFKIK